MENHTNERGKNSGTGKLFHSLSFYQTVATIIFEKTRLWCQFHFIRRCNPYKKKFPETLSLTYSCLLFQILTRYVCKEIYETQ